MRHFIKEYGYLAVMCVCLVCSAVLLLSVTTNRPLVAIAQQHLPVLRTQSPGEHEPETTVTEGDDTASGTQSGFVLTEEYLEGRLADFLPDNFPATNIDAEFEDGLVELSFSIDRTALKDYLESRGAQLGLRQDLLFQMLPRKLETEIDFTLSADENGLRLQPVALELGDKVFDLSALPESAFSAIDEGINALLKSAGVNFSSAQFTEDGILLQ